MRRKNAKYKHLTDSCKASLSDLSVTDKIALLVRLVNDVLPEAEVRITAPEVRTVAA